MHLRLHGNTDNSKQVSFVNYADSAPSYHHDNHPSPRPQSTGFMCPALAPTSTQIEYELRRSERYRMQDLAPERLASMYSNFTPGLALPGAANMPLSPPSPTGTASSASTHAFESLHATVQHLEQQINIIRETCEKERRSLEADRLRAEAIYKRERDLMELERTRWQLERMTLLQLIRQLETPAGASEPDWDLFPPASHSSVDCDSASEPEAMPAIDVQEILPELDGIPIRQNAVRKITFMDMDADENKRRGKVDRKSSSRSPPAGAPGPSIASRRSSDERTLEALAAGEEKRLTMHAGHTPNHSVAALPPLSDMDETTTASSSGQATPMFGPLDDAAEPTVQPIELPGIHQRRCRQLPVLEVEDDDLDEEVPLKAPLMVRNIPAKDEVFFEKLSKKLEDVARAETRAENGTCLGAAADMKRSDEEVVSEGYWEERLDGPPSPARYDSPAVPKESSPAAGEPTENMWPSIDAAMAGAVPEDAKEGAKKEAGGAAPARPRVKAAPDSEEYEIPMKFKANSNFGAPFGQRLF